MLSSCWPAQQLYLQQANRRQPPCCCLRLWHVCIGQAAELEPGALAQQQAQQQHLGGRRQGLHVLQHRLLLAGQQVQVMLPAHQQQAASMQACKHGNPQHILSTARDTLCMQNAGHSLLFGIAHFNPRLQLALVRADAANHPFLHTGLQEGKGSGTKAV